MKRNTSLVTLAAVLVAACILPSVALAQVPADGTIPPVPLGMEAYSAIFALVSILLGWLANWERLAGYRTKIVSVASSAVILLGTLGTVSGMFSLPQAVGLGVACGVWLANAIRNTFAVSGPPGRR